MLEGGHGLRTGHGHIQHEHHPPLPSLPLKVGFWTVFRGEGVAGAHVQGVAATLRGASQIPGARGGYIAEPLAGSRWLSRLICSPMISRVLRL